MAEEIINALTKVEGLRVAARTSAFQFKGKAEDAGRIGEALKVKTLLEGSVRTAGNRLRVTAQLINVEDGYHLWSERYDRETGDVFDIQDDIAVNIVEALKVRLVGQREVLTVKRPTQNLEAYHLYLKGRHYWYKRSQDALEQAIRLFERAIGKDPSFVLAYAGLAEAHSSLGFNGFLSPRIARSKAKDAAYRALELDDSLAEVHTALALIRFWFDWDWSGAEQEFKRALELSPVHAEARTWYGVLLSILKRQDEAISMAKGARELDPLSPVVTYYTGVIYYIGRQPEEAIAGFESLLEINPGPALQGLALLHSIKLMHKEAIDMQRRAEPLMGRSPIFLGLLAWIYARAARRSEAQEILTELEERAKREYVAPVFLSWVYAALDQKDEAFEYLERAYAEGDPYLIYLDNISLHDNLRSDPRFGDLVRRMDFP
jgi:tetratricopeptide (TPR) repeat protein